MPRDHQIKRFKFAPVLCICLPHRYSSRRFCTYFMCFVYDIVSPVALLPPGFYLPWDFSRMQWLDPGEC